MIARLSIALLLTVLSLGASANPCALGGRPFPVEHGSGIGGTGLKPADGDGSGIGGTGHRDGSGNGGTGKQVRDGDGSGSGGTGHRDGSGNGGTGIQARQDDGMGTGGTGVVGEITGFGSVCVNGLEIHYDAGTPVVSNGSPVAADQLAVGQMVAVEAVGKSGNLVARQIHVQHALIGRVQAVEGGKVKVWGQWVSLPGAHGLKQGDRIKVSGYRLNAGSIFATRIDAAKPREADLISGEAETVENGVATINGVRVRLPDGTGSVKSGKEFRAIGKPESGGFKADRIDSSGKQDLLDKVDRMVVQDSIHSGKGGTVRVGGVDFALSADTRIKGGNVKDLQPGQLVRIEARQKNGQTVIERIEIRGEAKDRIQKEKETGLKGSGNSLGAGKAAPGKDAHQEGGRHENESREERDRGEVEQPESHDRVLNERSERHEETEKAEKSEHVEKPEKAEKTEKAEKAEKPEKTEKPEKVEKAEKPEKPEKPEKVEKAEKPEKPEKDD